MNKPDLPRPSHEVLNQPPPLEETNLFELDVALRETVTRNGAGAHTQELVALGEDRKSVV